MLLFRKCLYRKPPDGLLEISERVYVFDCCFTTDVASEDAYKVYITSIVDQLRDHFPDASFMVINFTEEDCQSQISSILADYELTVVDYPRQYEGCPLLTMEMIHHFRRSCENWLSFPQNVLLMHCEQGGWPVLAFMLAALLVHLKQYPGEQRTLDMIYKQAPRELLQLLSPLNPLPSQLRYLHYISRRNVGLERPPLDRALTLDCVILRFIPDFDEMGGCRPIFRIYGPDPFIAIDRTPKVLFSTAKSKLVRFYKQEDCELVKIDIHCHIQGDVVLECISLDEDLEREQMMFRVMFNTAFIRSNILILDRDSIDILWDAKDRFPKDFRVEVLLSEMDAGNSLESSDLTSGEEKEGLPIEAFENLKEMFNLDWPELKPDTARILQHMASSRSYRDSLDADSPMKSEIDAFLGALSPRGLHDEFMYGETNYGHRKLLSSSTKKHLLSTQSPSQIKIISQRIHVSRSTPAFSSKSLPGSHATVSRYYSAPSALGIMALLDDHTVSDIPEVTHATKLASSVATSSASGSSISSKLSHSLSSRPLSSNSASYTKEAGLRRAHSLPPTSPPPPPLSPLIPPAKVASIAPPPPLPRSAPAKEASLAAPPTSIPPPPPPPLPHKGTSSAPASAGLEQSASSPVIPSPPPPPSMTSLSSHTNLLPSRKVIGTVGVRPPPPPPPCPGPAAATSAPPPPPPPCPGPAAAASAPPPPPPPPCPHPAAATSAPPPPPPPPPCPDPAAETSAPPPPPPPPCPDPAAATSAPPPPPPPHISQINSGGFTAKSAPPPPVPPCTLRSLNNAHSSGGKGANCEVIPPPPPGGMNGPSKGRLLRKNMQSSGRKTNLKPLHWVKVTRAVKGSLWAEPQNSDEFSKAPEFDMSELESLFSAAVPNADRSGSKGGRSTGPKSDKVHLIDLRRANNCEIMLTKVKMPLNDLMSSVLALDDSLLDGDQVDNLIKFCPTKEEMEQLKSYTGDKENLGKCEQYFLELMRIPRVESKLRVFSFKIQFNSQFTDLKTNLNIVNSCAEEIRTSVKLKRIMQTILSLGNALNQGTARGAAVGFRLDSLLKLTDTRARNNKMTLMHYLCKVLADKLPELLDFPKDLVSLEVAARMQLKCLAEEMQAINKGLEKVEQELTTSENDGHVSQVFCKTLREFLAGAEKEVRSLTSLYSNVGRNADALALYFGEDPARCPFEQVVSTLVNFVRMFVRAHEENCKHMELEKKKAQKEEAENEKAKAKQSKETTTEE